MKEATGQAATPAKAGIHKGSDPLQSLVPFKNTRVAPERPRSMSFAAATRASHQAPKFPGVAVRPLVNVDGEEVVKFTPEEVSQMAAAFT